MEGMKAPDRRRSGVVNTALWALLGSIVLMAGLIGLLVVGGPGAKSSDTAAGRPLVLYCAAGVRMPVEAVAREFEREFGVAIQGQYLGSHTLLANVETTRTGDLFLAADDFYLGLAQEKGLIGETVALATMKPVLAVAKGNPKGIRSIADLFRGDLRLAQANPDAAAIGRMTRDALRKSGHWDNVAKRTTVFKGTVNDVANDVKLGAVDAGFVWDATVRQYPALEAVSLPELGAEVSQVAVAVLKFSEQPEAALRFARYLAAGDKGQPEFIKHGYTVPDPPPGVRR
jgi:molybdate transport system substrate-binding protein